MGVVNNGTGDEKLIASVFGIMKNGRVSVGGFVLQTQNAIIVTDKRILIITVPIPGAELHEISMAQIMFMKSKIAEKGNQMLKGMSFDQILKSNNTNVSINFSEIQGIEFGKPLLGFIGGNTLKILTKKGDKISYAILNKEDLKNLKEVLKDYST
tara:strand:- start:2598 stop:3062 length:465 start_codon:yes stop_codon:yes gene_type:complete